MEKTIIDYFKNFSFLNLDDVKLIYSLGKLKRIKKGECIMQAGELNYNGYLVLKGLLRNYVITNAGEERTLLFSKEGDQTGSHSTLFYDEPSTEFIEAIENSVVFALNSKNAEKLAEKYPKLLKLQNRVLKKMLAESVERIKFFTVLTPEERYIQFSKQYPELFNRVPQKHLASYIGVTKVSLSRIKNRIVRKEIS
jgi:CRP-like cAMP-binding protein